MTRAYYNEIDLYCAEWLYNLQATNLIPPGDIDTRPIQDVRPSDLKGYAQHHFFAGLGGWPRALRQAHWPDHRAVWTGSCPCQPFSLAGKRGGFADDRHLWPYWRYLIAVGRPAIVFGEQVASASQWLGLVRGDLEALGYAVGAIPIEAASAGADHKRDRYWFVGNDQSDGRSEGRAEHELRGGRPTVTGDGGMEHAARISEREPDDEGNASAVSGKAWPVSGGSSDNGSVANPEREGPFPGALTGVHSEQESRGARHVDAQRRSSDGDLSDAERIGLRGQGPGEAAAAESQVQGANEQRQRFWTDTGAVRDTGEYEWVLGADGKARRVKPGICLLVNGVPNRVAKLRAFGNAIDPRPAQAFIESVMEILDV
jgi:DNA (cytosine-5)-methyltransferase 1